MTVVDVRGGSKGPIPLLPIVNQSDDQENQPLSTLSLSLQRFSGETNDPTPDVKLLAWNGERVKTDDRPRINQESSCIPSNRLGGESGRALVFCEGSVLIATKIGK